MKIEFKEKFEELLPYDRENYIEFLDDDFKFSSKWCGLSFQLVCDEKEIDLPKFIESYESIFKRVILKFDQNSFWVVNHDDIDLDWFPNEEDNLPELRTLFKQNNILNSFRGALVLMKDDLLKYSRELISYPFSVFNEAGLLYKDLDISHSNLQLIIKISGHWNIDFLSTDKELLKLIVNESSTDNFIIKEYRGNSIWI